MLSYSVLKKHVNAFVVIYPFNFFNDFLCASRSCKSSSGGFNINGGLKANTSIGDWVKGTGTGGFVLNDDGSAQTRLPPVYSEMLIIAAPILFLQPEASLMILFQIFNGHNPLPQIKMISITPCIMSLKILLKSNGGHNQWIMIGGDRLSTEA